MWRGRCWRRAFQRSPGCCPFRRRRQSWLQLRLIRCRSLSHWCPVSTTCGAAWNNSHSSKMRWPGTSRHSRPLRATSDSRCRPRLSRPRSSRLPSRSLNRRNRERSRPPFNRRRLVRRLPPRRSCYRAEGRDHRTQLPTILAPFRRVCCSTYRAPADNRNARTFFLSSADARPAKGFILFPATTSSGLAIKRARLASFQTKSASFIAAE